MEANVQWRIWGREAAPPLLSSLWTNLFWIFISLSPKEPEKIQKWRFQLQAGTIYRSYTMNSVDTQRDSIRIDSLKKNTMKQETLTSKALLQDGNYINFPFLFGSEKGEELILYLPNSQMDENHTESWIESEVTSYVHSNIDIHRKGPII